MNDQGSITPLIASYLALMLLTAFGVTAVGLAMVAGNRIQGIVDYAILYAHDRSTLAGVPTLTELEREVSHFLSGAQSARGVEIVNVRTWIEGDESHLRICGRHQDLLGVGIGSVLICKEAAAKSYELPRSLSGA